MIEKRANVLFSVVVTFVTTFEISINWIYMFLFVFDDL